MIRRSSISPCKSRNLLDYFPIPLSKLVIGTVAWLATATFPSLASIVISSQSTENIDCVGGVCAPTAADAVLNVGDLENLLAAGNVEVTTTGTGVQANDIDVDAALTWSSTGTLSLDAYQSIAVGQAMTVTGSGGLTVAANDGGSGGTFSFGRRGNVTFDNLSSPLIINGKRFKLVNSLPALIAAVNARPKGAFALANSYDAPRHKTYKRSPIGVLYGTIEGLGNTISHLAISALGYDYSITAMVREVHAKGVIENLHLSDIHIGWGTGAESVGAGLVGVNSGYLFGDSVTGEVIATGTGEGAGGMVGDNPVSYTHLTLPTILLV